MSKLVIENSTSLDLESTVLRNFLAVWREKRRDRVLPSRADFDPLEFSPAVWPHIALIDILAENRQRFRYRLLGTHIVEALGRDSTGRYIDETQSEANYDDFVAGFRQAVQERVPVRSSGNAIFVNKAWVTYESVILPLSADDTLVNMLMVPAVFTNRSEPGASELY